jgi:hypothetical protein
VTIILRADDNSVSSLWNSGEKLDSSLSRSFKTRRTKMKFAVAALLAAIPSAYAQSPCSPTVPEDVCQIEQTIYVQTDFKNTDQVRQDLLNLKNLLIRHDGDSSVVKEHILGLFDHVIEEAHEVRAPKDILAQAEGKPNLFGIYDQLKAYEKQNGPIVPLDWSLPDEIHFLVSDNTRRYDADSDRTRYDIGLFGVLAPGASVDQVQLIRYPNEILIDKQSNIGDCKEGTADSFPDISCGVDRPDSPGSNGLYLVNIQVKGKPMTHGWFVMSRTQVSATPVVQSPVLNQNYKTPTPTFHWLDFKSSEYRPFEQRKRKLSVYEHSSQSSTQRWSFNEIYPDSSESKTIGTLGDGATTLSPGDYSLHAGFEERWFFGEMLLGRVGTTNVPFTVTPRSPR